MGQAHGAGEHGRKEDMIQGNGVDQVLGVGRLPGTFHLLVDPKVRPEFEARLHHQFLVSQILIALAMRLSRSTAAPERSFS